MRGARALALGCTLAVLGACTAAGDRPRETPMARAEPFTDFTTLTPPSSPNRWLVAPPDAAIAGRADAAAPVFAAPAAAVVAAWIGVVRRQPRVRVLATSEDGLQVEAEQRSAVFGFADRISLRAVPLAPDRSTVFAYSRAETGYWDLGVNRRRLEAWLEALRAGVEPASAAQ